MGFGLNSIPFKSMLYFIGTVIVVSLAFSALFLPTLSSQYHNTYSDICFEENRVRVQRFEDYTEKLLSRVLQAPSIQEYRRKLGGGGIALWAQDAAVLGNDILAVYVFRRTKNGGVNLETVVPNYRSQSLYGISSSHLMQLIRYQPPTFRGILSEGFGIDYRFIDESVQTLSFGYSGLPRLGNSQDIIVVDVVPASIVNDIKPESACQAYLTMSSGRLLKIAHGQLEFVIDGNELYESFPTLIEPGREFSQISFNEQSLNVIGERSAENHYFVTGYSQNTNWLLLNEEIISSILLLLVLVSAVILVSLRYSHSLTEPLKIIRETVDKMVAGDLKAQGRLYQKNEFGQLDESLASLQLALPKHIERKTLLVKAEHLSLADDTKNSVLEKETFERSITSFCCEILADIDDVNRLGKEHLVLAHNQLLSKITNAVERNHGVIDSIAHNRIYASWGSLQAQDNDVADAVMAAVEVRIALDEINKARAERDFSPILLAMGMSKGIAVVGAFGIDGRLNYRALGKPIEKSAFLSEKAIEAGKDLLLDRELAAEIDKYFITKFQQNYNLPGVGSFDAFFVEGYVDSHDLPVMVKTQYCEFAELLQKLNRR
jgi:class 3 adenylate cyclase